MNKNIFTLLGGAALALSMVLALPISGSAYMMPNKPYIPDEKPGIERLNMNYEIQRSNNNYYPNATGRVNQQPIDDRSDDSTKIFQRQKEERFRAEDGFQ